MKRVKNRSRLTRFHHAWMCVISCILCFSRQADTDNRDLGWSISKMMSRFSFVASVSNEAVRFLTQYYIVSGGFNMENRSRRFILFDSEGAKDQSGRSECVQTMVEFQSWGFQCGNNNSENGSRAWKQWFFEIEIHIGKKWEECKEKWKIITL